MRKKDSQPDIQQTQFSTSEPFFEEGGALDPQKKAASVEKPRGRVAFVVLGLLGVLLLFVGISLLPKRAAVVERVEEIIEPEEKIHIDSSIEKKLAVLQTQIQEADPTRTTLVAPQTDSKLTVQEL